tara:strand:+ start:4367 stop:5134 length:768 start_codon:yes stop_codon:yes gene_type:complete
MSKKKQIIGQDELDQYKFDRNDIAVMLRKTPNAIRMMMRRKNCPLEYRYDGKKYLFKRPRDWLVDGPPDHLDKKHAKSVDDYHRATQKKYNRGATHEGKGNYPNDAFKLHNEMKIMNSINKKFTSEAHKREFMELNKEGLKIAQEKLFKKREKETKAQFQDPGKYGGMLNGYKGAEWQNKIEWSKRYDKSLDTSFKPFGDRGFSYYNQNDYTREEKEKEPVEIIWTEEKPKDPGAGYKPGRFPKLDEAIKNTKKK